MTFKSICHLKRRFINLKKVAFPVGHEKKDFKVSFDNLNHRFFDFIQIVFWACQEAENEFYSLNNRK